VISGERQKVMEKAVRCPCGVCGRGVGSDSMHLILAVRSGYTVSVVL